MKLTNLIMIALSLSCLAACSSLPSGPPPYENTYTVENRFAGDVKSFPEITIASTSVPGDVIEKKNITYVTYGKRELQLDLYIPKKLTEGAASKRAPGVILVHCGGWRSGFRTHLTPMAIELAKAGYVAATITYRLAPEAQYLSLIHI